MDRRIRIVWATALVAIVLILIGQGYWIAGQMRYRSEEAAHTICRTVDSLSSLEQQLRYARRAKLPDDSLRYSIFQFALSVDPDINTAEKSRSDWRIFLSGAADTLVYNGSGLNSQQVALMAVRYTQETSSPFDQGLLDSLLSTRGLRLLAPPQQDSLAGYRFTAECIPHASLWRPTVEVIYPANPLLHGARRLHVAVPRPPLLQQMAGQLLGSLLLVAVLVCCVVYQLKTVLIQRRIDAIRRTFIKNMRYEMKAPPAETETADEAEGIRIGDTRFFYSLNELHTPAGTVMITSRQAEILKLLAENPDRMVPRATLLSEVWGDDSYQNSMALNVQISYLRRALRSDSRLSIAVVTKKGYLLSVKAAE